MIQIEAGVPIPDDNRQRKYRFPLADMEIGDSFFLPDNLDFKIHTVRTLISRWGKLNGASFITRSVEGGLRVWRID